MGGGDLKTRKKKAWMQSDIHLNMLEIICVRWKREK